MNMNTPHWWLVESNYISNINFAVLSNDLNQFPLDFFFNSTENSVNIQFDLPTLHNSITWKASPVSSR